MYAIRSYYVINVVLRYVFNESIIWGPEVTLVLFAWLVLLGMSYAVKVTAHLGVDAVVNMLPHGPRRIMAVVAGILCIVYAFLLLKGAWDYWAPFAGLRITSYNVCYTKLLRRRREMVLIRTPWARSHWAASRTAPAEEPQVTMH